MKLIHRYLFKNIFLACLMTGGGLIMAVWLTQSLKLIDFWMNRGVPFDIFLKLVLFVLPDLIVIVLPIAFLIGLTFVFSRLSNDQELMALRACGFSDKDFMKSALFMAISIVTLLYAINLYILPQAFREFRSLENQLRSTIRASMVVPGEFNTFKNITLFVRERSPQGHLKGILIYDERSKDKPFTLLAESGQVLESPQGAVVILNKGTRQEIHPQSQHPSIVSFDHYTLRIITDNEASRERLLKPYEMSLRQLLFSQEKDTGYKSLKLQAEAHQRLLMPFLCLVFAFVVVLVFLKGDFNRRGRSKKIMQIMGICLGIEVLTLVFLHLGEKHAIGILGAYVTVLSCLIMGFIRLWYTPPALSYPQERR